MTDVRRLDEGDLALLAPIVANAYPSFGVHSAEDRRKLAERWAAQLADPAVGFYGAFRTESDGALVGGMKLYDFTMNLYGAQVVTGGVGLVAVDFFAKKQRIAYDLIQFFVRRERERGAPLVELYPFRPDFYAQMGFGYGTKVDEYRFAPGSLPRGAGRAHVRALAAEDALLVAACYERYQRGTHGMIARSREAWDRVFARAESRFAGVVRDGRVEGYLIFTFKTAPDVNFLTQDLDVEELVYETPEALAELLAFLRSQADEIRRVVLRTQEEDFHLVASDPRNGTDAMFPHVTHETNTQGVGLMYRVVDVPGFFAAVREHDFGGQTCRVQFTVRDSFLPENDGGVVVHFNAGRALVVGDSDADVQVALDVADFSSLVMGSAPFASLHRAGRATVSDSTYLATLDRLFRAERRPECMTAF
jgi:predicted acetyltransferase